MWREAKIQLDPSVSRRALRRAVKQPCELVSQHHDEPVAYQAVDLSPFGVWLETDDPLQLGEVVVACFRPPGDWHLRELMVFSEVTRVVSSRGGQQRSGGGMGLEFRDLTIQEFACLAWWLRNRPPPLPKRRRKLLRGIPKLPGTGRAIRAA